MKETCENLLHITVILSGHFAAPLKAGARGVILADEVNGDFTEQRKVLNGGSVADAAVIFAEGDINYPMQAILDMPVPADSLPEPLGDPAGLTHERFR